MRLEQEEKIFFASVFTAKKKKKCDSVTTFVSGNVKEEYPHAEET